jgi:hypothetical protein
MKEMRFAFLALGLLVSAGVAHAQDFVVEESPEAAQPGDTEPTPTEPVYDEEVPRPKYWWEYEEETEVRGYIGGLLGAGIGLNGQINSGQDPYVDTSVLFALRGGLAVGRDNQWLLGFEVAPVTNKLDWRLQATATGFVTFGSLVPIRGSKEWAWLWKVGFGLGGGLDYRFLIGVQLDVLTFNYKMNDRLWVDIGLPTIRFHIETAESARYNAQFVFPLGITFAI